MNELSKMRGQGKAQALSHDELFRLRAMFDGDDEMQAMLGPMEHAAFAREFTEENPWIGAPAMLTAIPAYSAAKALGLHGGRSPARISRRSA
jgi:hypothetical protein